MALPGRLEGRRGMIVGCGFAAGCWFMSTSSNWKVGSSVDDDEEELKSCRGRSGVKNTIM
jgi:hypothetical protein